ncbi:hypothetical protein AU255_08320 [Methyloprofundus sedimenti]|uniref:Uncharacterized protein n=1 Tax=Methyloprofundus sedimenti TaxID=1420851 RepID=A0A1V8M984_9GAMM|nr:hypothetical protein [Methyloprofundus sedimenti]OQK17853.1 hypothetical protein AU255_08320 [Methyloprofundus sedimenti]
MENDMKMRLATIFATAAFATFFMAAGAQAAECEVNKSIFADDKCTCPQGTAAKQVSAGYRQCQPTDCPVDKSIFAGNKCVCPKGTSAKQVSAGYRQCKK